MKRFPLSFGQEFWCSLDRGDIVGSFGHRCIIVSAWRLTGKVDVDALQGALDDVVVRHEVLRTSIIRDAEPRYQEIHPPSSVTLVVRDLPRVAGRSRSLRAEELLNEVEASTLSVRDLPLLRGVLGRFDDRDSVLVLTTHHVAADAWSMQLIIRDLAVFYAVRRGYHPPDLPDIGQYREFAELQRASSADTAVRVAREYWRQKLRGAQLFAIPCNPLPAAEAISPYSMHNFVIDTELTALTVKLAKEMRSSPFMVLLAVFYVLAHTVTGATDLVASTFTSGRNDPRFRDTVGIFFNFLPIRTDISGCTSFRAILSSTRANCLEAYSHDVSFAHIEPEVPDIWPTPADGDVTTVSFEMIQSPTLAESELVGDISYSEIRKRQLSSPVSTDIPNGVLWALDLLTSGELAGSVLFNRDQFDERFVADLVSEYRRALRTSVTAPDAPWEQRGA